MRHPLRARCRVTIGALGLLGTLALVSAGQASAETFHVSNATQLEEAIHSANTNTEANTIVLAGGAYLPTHTQVFTNTHGIQTIEGPTHTPEAILDGGNVEVEHPEFLVVNEGVSLTLRNLVVDHGGGAASGAIEDGGTVQVEGSTVAGNRGAGIIVQPGASAVVRNSTLSDGAANALVNEGTASLFNATVAFNKFSGVENTGVLNLANTIVAENGLPQCAGAAPATSDHVLSSDASCKPELASANPLLSGLFNDGGPTKLRSLEPGSPAIDAGNSATCTSTDQRGQPRPDTSSEACDIGADEYNETPPTIKVPSEVSAPATSSSGAKVTYSAEAMSSDDAVRSFSCAPKSGSTFPVGTTTVNCTATDGHGASATASFPVVVKDVTAPVIHVPENITTPAESPSGTKVSYTVTVTDPDNATSELKLSCAPESGLTFAIGETTVECTASDPAGNTSKASFKVTVSPFPFEFKEWIFKGSLTDHTIGTTLFTLPEGSKFNGHATIPGELEGDTTVPAFSSTVKLFGFLPISFGFTFTESGPVKGTISNDPSRSGNVLIKATATDTIGITSIGIFGLKIPTSCKTKEPVTFPLEASEPGSQLIATGASFSGQTTLPAIQCSGGFLGGAFGPILTLLLSGPSNPYAFTIEP